MFHDFINILHFLYLRYITTKEKEVYSQSKDGTAIDINGVSTVLPTTLNPNMLTKIIRATNYTDV